MLSGSDKSRLPSIFSRSRKDKDNKQQQQQHQLFSPGTPIDYYDSNSIGSHSPSRHNRESSIVSSDGRPMSAETGLSMMSGVITSIPYGPVNGGLRSPTEYLSKSSDQASARREPLPYELNKASPDFHQYPVFSPAQTNHSTNASQSGLLPQARPPPGSSGMTVASTAGRTPQLQQWGAPSSRSSVVSTVSTVYNGGRYDPHGRASADNGSRFPGTS